MLTHFEQMEALTAPWRPHARALIAKVGEVDAILKHSIHVDPGMQYAIWEEVVWNAIDRLPDPHNWLPLIGITAASPRASDGRVRPTNYHHGVMALYELYRRSQGEASANGLIYGLWHQRLFQANGSKVYEVAPGLAEHLHATELRGVTADHLRLPYPSIYVVVPKAAGFQVDDDVALDGKAPVEAFSLTASSQGGIAVLVVCRAPIIDRGLPTSITYTMDVDLAPGITIDEIIDRRREMVGAMARVGVGSSMPTWESALRWTFNLLLYMTHIATPEDFGIEVSKDHRDLADRVAKAVPGKKRDRLKERLKQTPKHERIYIGKGWPRVPHHDAGGDGKPLVVRTLVTGHWRNQAHGTGRLERRLIWIKPFWRGPEGAELSNPRRIVT